MLQAAPAHQRKKDRAMMKDKQKISRLTRLERRADMRISNRQSPIAKSARRGWETMRAKGVLA